MSAVLLSALLSMGASVWIFTKLQNQTGYGNSRNAFIGAGIAFVLLFVVVFSISKMVLHN
jgi:hypothetical protein